MFESSDFTTVALLTRRTTGSLLTPTGTTGWPIWSRMKSIQSGSTLVRIKIYSCQGKGGSLAVHTLRKFPLGDFMDLFEGYDEDVSSNEFIHGFHRY